MRSGSPQANQHCLSSRNELVCYPTLTSWHYHDCRRSLNSGLPPKLQKVCKQLSSAILGLCSEWRTSSYLHEWDTAAPQTLALTSHVCAAEAEYHEQVMSRKAAAYQQYLARKRMVMDYARQVSCLQQNHGFHRPCGN